MYLYLYTSHLYVLSAKKESLNIFKTVFKDLEYHHYQKTKDTLISLQHYSRNKETLQVALECGRLNGFELLGPVLIHNEYIEVTQIDDQTLLYLGHTHFQYLVGLTLFEIWFPVTLEDAAAEQTTQTMTSMINRLCCAQGINEMQIGSISRIVSGEQH